MRPGIAPAALAVVTALQLAGLRIALTADRAQAYWFGEPIAVLCGLRERTGLACPTCGFTRGVALALHGQFAAGWDLHPAAVLAVFSLAAAVVVLPAFGYRGYVKDGASLGGTSP